MAAKQNRFKSSRKEAERSKRGNRREWGRIANRLLLLVAVLGFVYGVERLSAKLDAIPVERVVFAGDLQRVDRDVLVERVTGQLAVGYIGLDLEAIQAELEQEPWVYRAVVERLWPRELKITIVEETPIAVWGRGGLLNHRGRIFVPQDGSDYGADLPRLDGPKGSAIEIMRQYRLMSQLLGDEQQLHTNYRKGINKGLMKILSKMGISAVASYRGAQLFEAVGLQSEVVDLCFRGTASRIEGAGFKELQHDQQKLAKRAFIDRKPLQQGGLLKYVHGEEYHAFNPDVVTLLQKAVQSGDYADWKAYAKLVNERPAAALRDLLSRRERGEVGWREIGQGRHAGFLRL